MFMGASSKVRDSNNSSQQNARPDPAKGGPRSLAEINERNRAAWTKKN
jgi:hypothetical protein